MITIRLSQIMIDKKLMTRAIIEAWVKRLIELIAMGAKFPPILVCRVNSQYVLLDGFNRVEAIRRAVGTDAKISAEITDAPNKDAMIRAAFMANKQHGKPYTEEELRELMRRLVHEEGWTKKAAQELLGLTEEHAKKFEDVKIVKQEASNFEQPITEERANFSEAPITPERADIVESPILAERANGFESPTRGERVNGFESPTCGERVSSEEQPTPLERPDMRAIKFHITRLRALIPERWTQARILISNLETRIIESVKEEPNGI